MSSYGKLFKRMLYKQLLHQVSSIGIVYRQKSSEYIDWIDNALVEYASEFTARYDLLSSPFIGIMNRAFRTRRFSFLLNRYIVDYLATLFNAVHESPSGADGYLPLEDNPLNRFAIEAYEKRFGRRPHVTWTRRPSLVSRFLNIISRVAAVIYRSMMDGFVTGTRIKKYKVMREALYGLYGVNGYYFHDDVLIDGEHIKEKDLLLFSRGVPTESFRKEGYHDAMESPYGHFTLGALPIGIKQFFQRVIPKYVYCGSIALFSEASSDNFSIFYSLYLFFTSLAIPYEKVFSNYMVDAELGHDYHCARHIPESIVCQSYGVRYYLMHWSDISGHVDRYLCSFLSCDKYFVWGKVHMITAQEDNSIFEPTGYIFKKFIKEVRSRRHEVLKEIGINARGKIISFFDESFGGGDSFGSNAKMTAEHFVNFWKTALETAKTHREHTIVVKPKEMARYLWLDEPLRSEFLAVKKEIEALENACIVNEKKWSFIEVIGVSDIVITQGMFSSATIAIICGIDGLYLDEARYGHPFRELFKDKVVFDTSEALQEAVRLILDGKASALKYIPENVIREFDAYPDDKAVNRIAGILAG